MFEPRFTITNKMNNALLEIERARGFLDAAKLKEEWIVNMQSEALALEAHHSTHIEGTKLTFSQAQQILRGKRVRGIKNDDRQELLNYKDAMDFVSDVSQGGSEITEDIIKEIHRILVKNVRGGSLEPGKYRKLQNYVINSYTEEIIYKPPPSTKVPPLMKEFVRWLNLDHDISPVIIAGISQFYFVDIHPFLDGNGRTARLLSTLVLYLNGYDFKRLFSLSEYYDKDRGAYYDAIQLVREKNRDLTGWIEYFSDGLRTQLIEIKSKGERAIKMDILLEKVGDYKYNIRQKRALEYLIDEHRIDNSIYQDICNTTKRTATRDLTDLVNLGLLERCGEKKGTYYVLKLFKEVENKGHG